MAGTQAAAVRKKERAERAPGPRGRGKGAPPPPPRVRAAARGLVKRSTRDGGRAPSGAFAPPAQERIVPRREHIPAEGMPGADRIKEKGLAYAFALSSGSASAARATRRTVVASRMRAKVAASAFDKRSRFFSIGPPSALARSFRRLARGTLQEKYAIMHS